MTFLESSNRLFHYYKQLGDKAMEQLQDEQLFWQANAESNSIAIIVKHLWGNMLSRWTDFLTTDGEKKWRNRDTEFDNDLQDKATVLAKWNEGWQCLFDALKPLTEADLDKIIYIRNDGQTVVDAINRQVAHYGYHVGQIVYVAKMLANENWTSLSIPKNASQTYNSAKFSKEKGDRPFTDDLLK